jgi:serine/threonine protein kinase
VRLTLFPSELTLTSPHASTDSHVSLSSATPLSLSQDEKYPGISIGSLFLSFPDKASSHRWFFAIRLAAAFDPSLTPDDFRFISSLGSDPLGSVSIMEFLRNGSVCAIRRIPVASLASPAILPYVTTFLAPDHPFLPAVSASLIQNGEIWLQCPYPLHGSVTGSDLIFTARQLIVAEMVQAVEILHDRNVVIGALNPENFLIDADSHIVLSEFGISRKLRPSDRSPFVAPEVADREKFSFASDWWSLGAILYSAVSGEPPLIDGNAIVFPKFMDSDTKGLLSILLSRDRKKRTRFEIKNHPFFSGVDWQAVLEKRLTLPAPRTPCDEHDDDDGNPPVEFNQFGSEDLRTLLEMWQDLE